MGKAQTSSFFRSYAINSRRLGNDLVKIDLQDSRLFKFPRMLGLTKSSSQVAPTRRENPQKTNTLLRPGHVELELIAIFSYITLQKIFETLILAKVFFLSSYLPSPQCGIYKHKSLKPMQTSDYWRADRYVNCRGGVWLNLRHAHACFNVRETADVLSGYLLSRHY